MFNEYRFWVRVGGEQGKAYPLMAQDESWANREAASLAMRRSASVELFDRQPTADSEPMAVFSGE